MIRQTGDFIKKDFPMRKTVYVRIVFLCFLAVYFVNAISGNPQHNFTVKITDETGAVTPARVKVIGSDLRAVAPPASAVGIMYGYGLMQGYERTPDSSFYVNGSFEMDLQPGRYQTKILKGYEYLQVADDFRVEEGQNLSRTYQLERWIDMPARGWYSADDHIHLRRSPRDNPVIFSWTVAEDIHVANLLWMGDFWTSDFMQYAWGKAGIYQEGNHMLVSGQEEPRTSEIGHTISLGADAPVRFEKEYYLYDKVFDRVHELNGISGYAHHGDYGHAYRGMTLDILRNKIDFLEVVQFVLIGPLYVKNYYHFLDLGFKLTATGGSDFPWGGRVSRFGLPNEGPKIGNARFYTYVGGELSFEGWLKNVKAGHTFATSDPMLEFTINGKLPGDELPVSKGTILNISAKAYGHEKQAPLRNLEIVGHSKVLARVEAHNEGQSPDRIEASLSLPAQRGIWIAARCSSGVSQIAHTTPIYITIDGKGFHNPETFDENLALCEKYLQEIENEIQNPQDRLDNQIWRYKDGLNKRIQEVRTLLNEMQSMGR